MGGQRAGPTKFAEIEAADTQQRTPDTEADYLGDARELYGMMVRETSRTGCEGPSDDGSARGADEGEDEGSRGSNDASLQLHRWRSHGVAPHEMWNVPMHEGIFAFLRWFQSQHARWRPSTIRRYRSAIACWIETVLPGSPDHDEEDVEEALALILDLEAGPTPKDRIAPKRTSAKKRRSVSEDEHRRIVYELTPRSGPGGPRADRTTKLCRLLVKHLPHLALRPVEVHYGSVARVNAELGTVLNDDLDGAAFVLRVVNAKATNGRGNGPVRTLDLSAYKPKERQKIETLLALAAELLAKESCADLLHGRLSERLARACDRARVPRICFYTLRHQALATAKAHGSLEEAAALAGHGVTSTVAERYGQARSGWKNSPRVTATPDDVARVKDNAKRFSQRMMRHPNPNDAPASP